MSFCVISVPFVSFALLKPSVDRRYIIYILYIYLPGPGRRQPLVTELENEWVAGAFGERCQGVLRVFLALSAHKGLIKHQILGTWQLLLPSSSSSLSIASFKQGDIAMRWDFRCIMKWHGVWIIRETRAGRWRPLRHRIEPFVDERERERVPILHITRCAPSIDLAIGGRLETHRKHSARIGTRTFTWPFSISGLCLSIRVTTGRRGMNVVVGLWARKIPCKEYSLGVSLGKRSKPRHCCCCWGFGQSVHVDWWSHSSVRQGDDSSWGFRDSRRIWSRRGVVSRPFRVQ